MFSSISFTITKENYDPLLGRKCSLELDLKKSEFLKGFCDLFVFGFLFTIIKQKAKEKLWSFMVKKMDQVYYNTRVSTQVNTSQHESTRVNKSSTRINTSQHNSTTNQHESDTSQHESTLAWHESTRVRDESTRINANLKQA